MDIDKAIKPAKSKSGFCETSNLLRCLVSGNTSANAIASSDDIIVSAKNSDFRVRLNARADFKHRN